MFQKNVSSFITCSQIWLNLPMDYYGHFDYITKLTQQNKVIKQGDHFTHFSLLVQIFPGFFFFKIVMQLSWRSSIIQLRQIWLLTE
jgi:hypothetical protein